MKNFSIIVLCLCILDACSNGSSSNVELFSSGAKISGVNGIHFGPDGFLYATSVIGSDISVVDTKSKKIIKRYGPEDGVLVLMMLHLITKENFIGLRSLREK